MYYDLREVCADSEIRRCYDIVRDTCTNIALSHGVLHFKTAKRSL